MEVTKHIRTTIRFDGPALAGHEMDVQELAPALLALADMIQIANRKFNGDKATMRVLVNADVEQRCFMLDISLLQTFMDQAISFFGTPEVATAKEIAEWLGLISGGAVSVYGGAQGLLALVKFLRNRENEATPLKIEQSGGMVNIAVTGDGNTITVTQQTYELAQDPRINDGIRKLMKPLQREGYEELSFLDGDKPVFEVNSDEAGRIIDAQGSPVDPLPTDSVSTINGVVRIKSAQYEGAAKWSFMWNGRSIDADMDGQAAEWVAAFQNNQIDAPPNTVLEVTMTETVKLDAQGNSIGRPAYAVTEVRSASPPAAQMSIL